MSTPRTSGGFRVMPLVFHIGYSIVGPLVISIFVGRYIDQRFNTAPRYLLIFLGVSFLFTILLLFVRVRRYLLDVAEQERRDDTADTSKPSPPPSS